MWPLIYIVVLLIAAVVVGLMAAGKGQVPTQDKALDIPTPEIGKPIGVLFGTRLIKYPHLVWYGNLRIIKKKVNAGGKK
jgi:hypothetical protein